MRVFSRIFCGMVLLWNCLLSAAQPITPFVPTLPAVRPAPKSVSLDLTGTLPKAHAKNAVTVEIDASASSGRPAPKLWLGMSLSGASVSPESLRKIGRTLVANEAEFIRVDFDATKVDEIVTQADALLPMLKSAGLSVILCIHFKKLSADLETTLQTLSAPKYGVVRWECAGKWSEFEANYAPFARAVRRIAPTSPVGIYSASALTDTPDATRFVRLLSVQKIPCDSFAWRVEATAAKLFDEIQATRKVLAKSPALKAIILWPDLYDTAQGQAHSTAWDAALPFVSGAKPNAVAGMMIGSTMLFDAEKLTQQGKELGLRQKIGGILLKVPLISNSAVSVAAAQEGKGIAIYLATDKSDKFVPRPITLHIKNLPENLLSGWRITRYDSLSVYGEILSQKGKPKTVLRPVATSDVGIATELELKTVLLSASPIVLECRPQPLPNVKIVLKSDRLICHAGETVSLEAFLTNAVPKAWSGKAELTGTLNGLITDGLRSTSILALTPDKTHLMRYRVKIPVTAEDTTAFVNLAVNGVRSSLELRILAPLKIAVLTPRLDLDVPGGTADIRLLLANRGAKDLPLILENSEKIPLIVPQGKEIVQTISTAIRERDAGVYRSTLRVKYGEQTLGSVETLIGVPYLCRYAALKPSIDGELSEWTDATPIGMGRQEQIRGKTWRGPTDLSAYAYAKWDESFLYLACAVTDDFIVPPAPEAVAATGDSVCFAVTPDPTLVNSEQGYGSSDMEFSFALAKDGQTNLWRTHGTNTHPAGKTDKAIVAIKRSGSRTFYEAAIPWQELGMTQPTNGRKFGLTIAVNDDDGEGRGAIVWSDGFFGAKRPSLFPPLRLIK